MAGPVGEWPEEKKLGQQMSQGEFERQQILDEMKKRTPLHRDSSWIRQRSSSSSFAKEPVALGNDPVRRSALTSAPPPPHISASVVRVTHFGRCFYPKPFTSLVSLQSKQQ